MNCGRTAIWLKKIMFSILYNFKPTIILNENKGVVICNNILYIILNALKIYIIYYCVLKYYAYVGQNIVCDQYCLSE